MSDPSKSQLDRETMPVADEHPPALPFIVVGMGASAGGLEAAIEFFEAMPPATGMAFVLIQHLPPDHESMLAEILGRHTEMTVLQIEDRMAVQPNHVYVIRPGYTVTLEGGRLRLGERLAGPMNNRPIDDFFRSLASDMRERSIVMVLSGMGSNGSAGAQAVKAVGGLCIAQDPDSARFDSMPRHLIQSGNADYVLRLGDVPDTLLSYATHPYVRRPPAVPDSIPEDELELFREVLSLLKTRARHDFKGYKEPTLVRRIQRRMGLHGLMGLAEYTRLLRHSTPEVVALADDLLIHVTGFFRDPEAWEALRQSVIVPLVEGLEAGSTVRAWVAACATGEEAYTLAMLLIEESERLEKYLDIKVFATDMAERTLQNARQGVYPGGIEAEITPERVERFFVPEDEMYRVRPELRDRVVFAAQNVLQDPPFSRLDIATCRNLLIYLRPEVQHRVLSILHFGLREGGALFLGTSETAVGAEDMFELIDKKARIFRRIGAARHATLEFPLPRTLEAFRPIDRPAARLPPVIVGRPSLAQLTTGVLLAHHTPAAVTVDADCRILYYHGATERYLSPPRGEAIRDLSEVVLPSLRAAVRAAVQQATTLGESSTVLDGTMPNAAGTGIRVAITATPLHLAADADHGVPDYVVVSFQDRPELPPSVDPTPDVSIVEDHELRTVRGQLRRTVDDLQTSNEQLKAAHEEVVSINEELQSMNEELETSREEMQSLNEELATINSQLHLKVEEHRATSDDLTSLLTSTDIAVLFLDPGYRIRRFTPLVRDLVEVLPTDVGRPLSDLAWKFQDPDLLTDAAGVLERLVPSEREVQSDAGRSYSRRITPYRTADHRIDGVVVAFLETTERRRAERAFRESEDQFRRAIEEAPVPIIVVEEGGQVLRVSRAWTELTGYTVRDLSSLDLWLDAAVESSGASELRTGLRELFACARTSLDVNLVVRNRGGGRRYWTLTAGAPEELPEGTRFVVGMVVDVTLRREAELALHESQDQLRRILRHVPAGILLVDRSGSILFANTAADALFGASMGDVARVWPTVVDDEGRRRPLDLGEVVRSVREAETVTTEEMRLCVGDDERIVSVVVTPVRDSDDGISSVVFAFADVTERKRFEEALHERESQLRMVVEGARDFAMVTMDRRGLVTTWNAGARRMMGYETDEMIGRRMDVLFTPEDRQAGAPEEERETAEREGQAQDRRWHVRKDESRFWADGVLHALRGPRDELRGFVKVMRDETPRKRAEDVILASRNAAEEANRLKDEFLATLSHELRTPLSAILMWAGMLRGKQLTAAQQSDGLDAILRGARAQKQLIDDLLDLSRITTGKLRLEKMDVDLQHLVRTSVDALRPLADAKRIRLGMNLQDVGTLQLDPARISQVLWNLLTNAVKFTPPGGDVNVELIRHSRHVEVCVRDTGQGIPAEFLSRVFEPFVQADGIAGRRQGGLGLGLSIARDLVRQHGGEIGAYSGGVGAGATFRVCIPAADGEVTPDNEARVLWADDLATSLAGVRVLLVEDEPDTRAVLCAVLRGAGAHVIDVASAQSALTAFANESMELVVSDIGLPDEDGYQLIARIRAFEVEGQLPRVPAMALSAFADTRARERAVEAGFDVHLGKPAEPEQLLRLAGRLIAGLFTPLGTTP